MEMFANGEIEATQVINKYNEFRRQDNLEKTKRLLVHRITGGQAYKIKKQKEEDKK